MDNAVFAIDRRVGDVVEFWCFSVKCISFR